LPRVRLAHPAEAQLVFADDRTIESAYVEMFATNRSRGVLGTVEVDAELVSGVGPDRRLEVQLVPNREKAPVKREEHPSCDCALCHPNDPNQRGVAWREFVLWPNNYPYAGPKSEHAVITAAKHKSQGFDRALLDQLFDLQRLIGKERPATLHYNGTAGNSQYHWHWQSTRERLPIERGLDQGWLEPTALRRDPTGSVSTIDRGFFRAIVIEGDRKYAGEWAERIVKQLESDPVVQGHYNLLLIPPRGERSRLVIFPRCGELKPVDRFGRKHGLGAFTLGGRMVTTQVKAPIEELVAGFIENADKSTVHPRDLAWLEPLVRAPRTSSWIAAQKR
jgi:hypothetical protein